MSRKFYLFGRIITKMKESSKNQALVIDKEVVLRKPHEMIVMVPRSATITLTSRRIYSVLLQVAQTHLDNLQSMPTADFLFEAPLKNVLKSTGSKGSERAMAKKYLSQMHSIEVDWESTAPGDGVKWRGFSMLSEVVLEVRKGENWVSWMFPPSIMSALKDPSRWARIDLEILAQLDTYACIALYDICVRYRNSPGGLTSRKPSKWWTDALSNVPGGDRREWRKFKNERVKPAIEEINTKTDLVIELIEHKEGKVVVDVQFSVLKKNNQTAKQIQQPVDISVMLRAQSQGISDNKIDALIREFGEAKVSEQLLELERRAANTTLKSIDSPHAYLRALLIKAADPSNLLINATLQPLTPTISPEVATPIPKPLTDDSQWLGERIRNLTMELEGLPEPERRHWLNLAVQDLSARGLLTSAISRRATLGEIPRGLLGNKAVHLYAERTYGLTWNVKPSTSHP